LSVTAVGSTAAVPVLVALPGVTVEASVVAEGPLAAGAVDVGDAVESANPLALPLPGTRVVVGAGSGATSADEDESVAVLVRADPSTRVPGAVVAVVASGTGAGTAASVAAGASSDWTT
jgi:hypothetical protein